MLGFEARSESVCDVGREGEGGSKEGKVDVVCDLDSPRPTTRSHWRTAAVGIGRVYTAQNYRFNTAASGAVVLGARKYGNKVVSVMGRTRGH
jgi:hypothetical protein